MAQLTMTAVEARLRAHEESLRTDATYRALHEWRAARQEAARRRRQQRHSRVFIFDRLPMARVFMRGPRWERLFDVRQVPVADLDVDGRQRFAPGRKRILRYSFEADVRELVLQEVREGVLAMWNDPYEQLGLRRQ